MDYFWVLLPVVTWLAGVSVGHSIRRRSQRLPADATGCGPGCRRPSPSHRSYVIEVDVHGDRKRAERFAMFLGADWGARLARLFGLGHDGGSMTVSGPESDPCCGPDEDCSSRTCTGGRLGGRGGRLTFKEAVERAERNRS